MLQNMLPGLYIGLCVLGIGVSVYFSVRGSTYDEHVKITAIEIEVQRRRTIRVFSDSLRRDRELISLIRKSPK
jgi:hypothetical protein